MGELSDWERASIAREGDLARRAGRRMHEDGDDFETAREKAEQERADDLHSWLHETPATGYHNPGPGKGEQ